jgi:hypothetical protein
MPPPPPRRPARGALAAALAAAAAAVAVAVAGCGTFNAARPLAPGEHAVGATFGGPLVRLGAPIPLPSLVLEGRHGLRPVAQRPFDVHYGLNATAAAFGLAQVHGGVGWQLTDQQGGLPAFTVADRFYLASSHLAAGRWAGADRALWALNQLDLLASWDRGRLLGYTGLSQLTDLRDPGLHLAPILGGQVGLGEGQTWGLQLEARYFGVNRVPASTALPWVSFGTGALGLTLGVQKRWGAPE